ncbi:leucine-rich repeat domain-containing protein [Flagellimonas lutimaris]|uniref:leucine-rich repeat domain-containing protein n=1 Tax=Flagellimonas lutimaris TaxID=475082 RepID=UPI003F5CDDB7
MKRAFSLLLLLTLFISCSESEEPTPPETPETPNAVEQGAQSFSISNKDITAKNSTNLAAKEFIPAYVFVSVETSNGNKILDRQKLDVIEQEGDYVTDEIMLDPGTYKLTEFIVVDSADLVISLVPKATSALSQFTGTSLPFNFTVQEGGSKNTPIENIETAGYSWVEFGYEEDDLGFTEAEDFFTLTVDDSENLTTKVISLKSLTGSTYQIDWGDGTVDEYVSTLSDININNELSHDYVENGIYEIKIIGAVEVLTYVILGGVQEDDYYTNIVSVDLNNLILLKTFGAYGGKLTSIDVSQNNLLEELWIASNKISSVVVTNNAKLKSLYIGHNELTNLDVSQNSDLEILTISSNQISELDISNNSKLITLLASGNALTQIDFSNNLVLEQLNLGNNLLSSIDLSQNLNLREINVGRNNLTQIDLSKNTKLERIDLYENQISSIDLSANLKLRDLYIGDNLLDNIDLSVHSSFERLSIHNNNLSSLDLSNNPLVSHLYIGSNQFSGAQLDLIISGVYDNAVLNSINPGYIDFQNNPGTDLIDQSTIAKINELALDYNWSFNNG